MQPQVTELCRKELQRGQAQQQQSPGQAGPSPSPRPPQPSQKQQAARDGQLDPEVLQGAMEFVAEQRRAAGQPPVEVGPRSRSTFLPRPTQH